GGLELAVHAVPPDRGWCRVWESGGAAFAVPCWWVVDGVRPGQTQPLMRLLTRRPLLSNGSPEPPKNGRLDRSMSTLIAPSRVAARTMLTSQVFSDWPASAARSSALAFTDSGIRRVIRDIPPSSTSSGAGGGGGVGGVGTATW